MKKIMMRVIKVIGIIIDSVFGIVSIGEALRFIIGDDYLWSDEIVKVAIFATGFIIHEVINYKIEKRIKEF